MPLELKYEPRTATDPFPYVLVGTGSTPPRFESQAAYERWQYASQYSVSQANLKYGVQTALTEAEVEKRKWANVIPLDSAKTEPPPSSASSTPPNEAGPSWEQDYGHGPLFYPYGPHTVIIGWSASKIDSSTNSFVAEGMAKKPVELVDTLQEQRAPSLSTGKGDETPSPKTASFIDAEYIKEAPTPIDISTVPNLSAGEFAENFIAEGQGKSPFEVAGREFVAGAFEQTASWLPGSTVRQELLGTLLVPVTYKEYGVPLVYAEAMASMGMLLSESQILQIQAKMPINESTIVVPTSPELSPQFQYYVSHPFYTMGAVTAEVSLQYLAGKALSKAVEKGSELYQFGKSKVLEAQKVIESKTIRTMSIPEAMEKIGVYSYSPEASETTKVVSKGLSVEDLVKKYGLFDEMLPPEKAVSKVSKYGSMQELMAKYGKFESVAGEPKVDWLQVFQSGKDVEIKQLMSYLPGGVSPSEAYYLASTPTWARPDLVGKVTKPSSLYDLKYALQKNFPYKAPSAAETITEVAKSAGVELTGGEAKTLAIQSQKAEYLLKPAKTANVVELVPSLKPIVLPAQKKEVSPIVPYAAYPASPYEVEVSVAGYGDLSFEGITRTPLGKAKVETTPILESGGLARMALRSIPSSISLSTETIPKPGLESLTTVAPSPLVFVRPQKFEYSYVSIVDQKQTLDLLPKFVQVQEQKSQQAMIPRLMQVAETKPPRPILKIPVPKFSTASKKARGKHGYEYWEIFHPLREPMGFFVGAGKRRKIKWS